MQFYGYAAVQSYLQKAQHYLLCLWLDLQPWYKTASSRRATLSSAPPARSTPSRVILERVVQSFAGQPASTVFSRTSENRRGPGSVASSIFNSLLVAFPPRTPIDAFFVGLLSGFCFYFVLVLLSPYLRRLLGPQLSQSIHKFIKLVKKHLKKSDAQRERQISLMTRSDTLLARQIVLGSATRALQEQQVALTIRNNALLEQQVGLIIENNALQKRLIALGTENNAGSSELKEAIMKMSRILAASVPATGALSSGPSGNCFASSLNTHGDLGSSSSRIMQTAQPKMTSKHGEIGRTEDSTAARASATLLNSAMGQQSYEEENTQPEEGIVRARAALFENATMTDSNIQPEL